MTGHPFVYVARRQDGARKVGFSHNPQKRAKHLRFCAGPVVLERTWQLEDARAVEAITHRLLRHHLHPRAEGFETYNLGLDAICIAVETAITEAKRPGAIKKYLSPDLLPPIPLTPFEAWAGDIHIWQMIRQQRHDEIAAKLGRPMTRTEKNEWLANGGMADHPAPQYPGRKVA